MIVQHFVIALLSITRYNNVGIFFFCSYNIYLIVFSEGGLFKAHLLFPKEYPQRPPKMRFISEMWHPNGR